MKTLFPRFSLRFLLLAAALIPLGAYWFFLPTLYAQRFAAAVTSGEYDAAEKLCIDRKEPFPGHWRKHRTFQPRPIDSRLERPSLEVCLASHPLA